MSDPIGNRIDRNVAEAQLQRESWRIFQIMAEILTLVQTGKSRRIPIVLVGSEFWSGLLDWFRQTMIGHGTITADDMDLMQVHNEPEDIVKAIFHHYEKRSLEPSQAEQEILLEL